jgi:hypothetical protein
LERPQTSRQLFNQSEFIAQASIGLDPDRRSEVEKILLNTLLDPNASLPAKLACVEIGRELSTTNPDFCDLAIKVTIESASVWGNYGNARLFGAVEAFAARLAQTDRSPGCFQSIQVTLQSLDVDTANPIKLENMQQKLDDALTSRDAFTIQVCGEAIFHLRRRLNADQLLDAANTLHRIYTNRFAAEGERARVSRGFAAVVAALLEKSCDIGVHKLPIALADTAFREEFADRLAQTEVNLSHFRLFRWMRVFFSQRRICCCSSGSVTIAPNAVSR